MAKPKCFCGCGDDVPRFPLFIRSANNLGRDGTERLAYTRAILGDEIGHPSFASLRPFEDLLLHTPLASHRDALRDAGAPLTAETLGTSTPRRGILTI